MPNPLNGYGIFSRLNRMRVSGQHSSTSVFEEPICIMRTHFKQDSTRITNTPINKRSIRMRKLIVVRIVHASADMGSMSEELVKEGMAKMGKEKWLENQRKIENFWNDLEKEIDELDLDYSRTRVYQDGLPASGELGLRIVNETADKGSRNYRIVRKLIESGSSIEATESPELLLKEYEHIKAIITAATAKEKADAVRGYEQKKDELMRKRDEYVAKAIDSTLKDGETGLLFIGAAHDVVPKLPDDIDVKKLD